jgi:uncharacterized protein YabE (DUF348 family)
MRAAPLIHPHHFRRRHHAAAIMVVVVLAVLSFQVFPGRDVTVIKDGAAYRVSSLFDPASDALAAAAVSLEPGDRVLAGNEGSHTSVAVQRARPVIIDVDGQSLELRSLAGTVGGVLAESGVTLKPGDEVLLDGQAATTRSSLAAASYTSRRSKPISNEVAAVDPAPLRLTVVRARPVEVIVDTHQVELSSAASTVAGVLQHMGMSVREGDLVRPGLDTPVTAGLTIRLARARSVNLRLDGKHEVLYTQARTVQDVLDILGVSPGPDDVLSPSRETRIIDGMNIVIGRTRVVDEVMDENVPAPVVFETDSSLPNGQVRVVPGTPGLKQTTYAVTYKNGVETGRTLTRAGVARAAVPTRVITGTSGSGGVQMLDVPGYSGPFSRKMTVRTTWYNATHGAWAREDPNYGLTRSGVMLDYGICAVDPNVIPLGTRFYVPGYGVCLAADTGGLVRGNHVDLGFPEEAGWNPWNTQTLDIYILG